MKKKINVIDLDKTLIPYDSFRLLVKVEIFRFNFYIFFYSLLRVLRVISIEKSKKKIILQFKKKYDATFFRSFALNLYHDIDLKVLEKIEKETGEDTGNILISASPDIYVKPLIEKLGWDGSGSFIDKSGTFVHLHGKGKINWLNINYKENDYVYNFAISDSSIDDELLSLFRRKLKWTLQ